MGKIENSKIENYKSYAFVLGREQKIALLEIESVLRRFSFYFDKNYPERSADSAESRMGDYYSILSLQDNIAIIKFAENCNLSPLTLMEQLGGTVKIFQISNIKNQNYGLESSILNLITGNRHLKPETSQKGTLNFGISDYSESFSAKQLNEIGIRIKIHARKKRPVRFIAGKQTELSSATSWHKIWKTGGVEVGLFSDNSKFKIQNLKFNLNSKLRIKNLLVGHLVATSNPDEWSERDYGKPAGDKYSGMMPPKLARMLVNLALDPAIINDQLSISDIFVNDPIPQLKIAPKGSHREKLPQRGPELVEGKIENLNEFVVTDPFCGSGNILIEAMLLGCRVIGSDISDKAVRDTRTNLEWLCNSKFKFQNLNFNLNSKLEIENSVFEADATSFDFSKKLKSCVIVTEPYLGKPKKVAVSRFQLAEEIELLKKLYLDFFRNLLSIINHSSFLIHSICFVFPLIETTDSGTISLYSECIDDLRKMGYNPIRTLEYGRDYQVVKRCIALLQPNNQGTKEPKNG